jgi:Rho-binding antiterminator
MNTKYQPISCHFYDELELLAIRRQACQIIFRKDGEAITEINDQIMDFKIIDKAEYLILKNHPNIRLDYLISVNGKELNGYC